MKHLFRYQLAAMSSLALLSSVLYGQNDEAKMRQFNERLTALEHKAKERKIYNSSARPEVAEGYNVYITGALLWWKAQENGLEYAVKTDDPFQISPNNEQSIKNLQFEYDSGFRLGLGYNIPHDSWDLLISWTQFDTGAKGHITTNGSDGLFPVWTALLDTNAFPFTHAKAHWKLDFNIVDGEVGREYLVGKWLTMRPSIGLRTVWIKQHYNVRYEDFFSPTIQEDHIRLVNDYSGIGPKATIDSIWDLCWGFNLYGSGTLSLLYGEFEIRRNEDLKATIARENKFHDDYHLVRAMADIQIGVGWDVMFFNDKFHFGLRFGWEQMLFFGQNQLYRLANFDFAGSVVSNLGDLSFQGGTFSARIDF